MTKSGLVAAVMLLTVHCSMASDLKPLPSQWQVVPKGKKSIIESRPDLSVEAKLQEEDGVFVVLYVIENKTHLPLAISPLIVSLENGNHKSIGSVNEQTLRTAIAKVSGEPVIPTQAPKKLQKRADGTIEEDNTDQLINNFGAAMQTWQNRRDAQKRLSEIEKFYARDETVESQQFVLRELYFVDSTVSRTTPFVVKIKVAGESFLFSFK